MKDNFKTKAQNITHKKNYFVSKKEKKKFICNYVSKDLKISLTLMDY